MEKKKVLLDQNRGLRIPPFLLHTYEAREDHCGLAVMANTTFEPEDRVTHDTYSAESFYELIRK